MESSENKYLHKKFKKQMSYGYATEERNGLISGVSCDNNKLTTSATKTVANVPNFTSNSTNSNDGEQTTIADNQSSISNTNTISTSVNRSVTPVPIGISTKVITNNINYGVTDFNFDTLNISESNITNSQKSSRIDTVNSICKTIDENEYVDEGVAVTISSSSISTNFVESITNHGTSNGNSAGSGMGKYVCTYCNLACSKPSVLQKHIRAHTNERPYPCLSCGFSFKTRSNLYKHCRSRTHANRVMGNKHVAQSPEEDASAGAIEQESLSSTVITSQIINQQQSIPITIHAHIQPVITIVQQKQKPYKPRFHTAKLFFEEENNKQKENDSKLNNEQFQYEYHQQKKKSPAPDLLKLRINELINRNNSIMNCDEAVVIRRTNIDNFVTENNNEYNINQWNYQNQTYSDEQPLNLTAKNRKRCLSDSMDNTQKSLIKELLLKNLSSDPNLQCQYCKMIFQTVTELEMHKLKYCNAKSSVRYTRSSSVNVASILTQNKNAFDNIPHMQHTTFPLKSPGPFLGKTRLIDSEKNTLLNTPPLSTSSNTPEKYRTFSFDDNVIMNHSQSDSPSYNKYFMHSPVGTLPLSPQIKKNPIKLFGGEVKITQTSGETRSFKIESESIQKMDEQVNFMDFKLSENLVIKSTLQSGGTVLQNKTNYNPPLDKHELHSPNVIRVYENSLSSVVNDKSKYYKQIQPISPHIQTNDDKHLIISNNEFSKQRTPSFSESSTINADLEKDKELYKTNLMDFGQKAMKMLAPNLKPPNLTIPGLPIPSISPLQLSSSTDQQHLENLNFAKKQISLQQHMTEISQPQTVYNPMNIIVNGKVIRYVPGIPGPIIADSMPLSTKNLSININNNKPNQKSSTNEEVPNKTPTIVIEHQTESTITPISEPIVTSAITTKEEMRKFARPTSLSLKLTSASVPGSGSFKSHHGLTPTMFNQALISPDTPRVAKKYCQQYLNGNYFSYLGLKSSTKSVYCTLNKTQPFYVNHFKKLSMYSEWRQQESKIDSLNVSAYDSRQRQQNYTMARRINADFIAHSSYKFVKTEIPLIKEENITKNQSLLGGYESNEDYTYIRGRGRGRYVCDQCGIRCKKPSMLKKHIRTHSDDRPFTCEHCNFSFKTKGNLTKHMKSKAHSKKSAATNEIPNQNNEIITTSSESDESEAESSDESTRLQEHEAAECLLSLAQKNNQQAAFTLHQESTTISFSSSSSSLSFNLTEFPNSFLKDDKFLKNSDQISQVTNTNFVKNKILDEGNLQTAITKSFSETYDVTDSCSSNCSSDVNNFSQFFGKSSTIRPLTYPYLQTQFESKLENNSGLIEKNLPTNLVLRKRKLSTSKSPILFNNKSSKMQETSEPDIVTVTVSINNGELKKSPEPLIIYNQSPLRLGSFSEANNSETIEDKSIEDQDQSAMQTLAEIAITQVKIENTIAQIKMEKNILAKNVASEYLKLALNNDQNKQIEGNLKKFSVSSKEVGNEVLVVKPEESKNCSICSKNFSKPSQLRLHMNIHYLERPFRCESCSVSFRTRGHFQKHERSAGHHNKLSSSPALSSQEPRPFKCTDCNIAFRIHGHLAKHLRSKMHIMKLECLAKIPFGLYAELERANSLLTEINTTDGDMCLESLKILARKLFSNDPSKLDQLETVSENRDS